MFSTPHYHQHHLPIPTLHFHCRHPIPPPSLLPFPPLSTATSSSLHCHFPSSNPRTQNSSSTSLLLRSLPPPPDLLHLQPQHQDNRHEDPRRVDLDPDREHARKQRLLEEISLVSRGRNPRYPGSIDFPENRAADLHRRTLRDALETRRGVVQEILRVSLRASKLSFNFSRNLVEVMPEFVDFVLVEAAEMRRSPEFAHLSFNARVRSYIDNSGVVPLVKWLKHNSMSYPQIGKLICMTPTNLELLRYIVEWLKLIHVKGEFLGNVLVKAGPIWERGMEELNDVVRYLEEKGVRMDWMGVVVSRCPKLLTLTIGELEQRVEFYMHMGLNQKDFGTMVYDYPKALGAFSMEEMNCKVNYLKEFGLSTADVGHVLAYKPQLIGCSIEETWKPLVKYMYYLGIQKQGMMRILMTKPTIFCVDLKRTIVPKVRFFQDIGIREEAIGSTLIKFPHLLTYSLNKKIRPLVIFLITKAGVKQTDIGKVIASEPELVGCSIMHKLDISVKYFLSLGISLSSLGEMISDFPMLLKYNLDVLRPKYRYLRRVMVRPLQDLIEFPRFFSYSLEAKIIPRHKVMVENRVNFKLRYMLAGTDEDFHKRVRDAVERRRTFEAGSESLTLATSAAPDEKKTMLDS